MISYNEVNEVPDELFDSLRSRYQANFETSMRGSNFISDLVQLMYYKCYKVNFRRGGSYIDSPDSIKKKKVTINPKNEDDKCFQYAVTVALNYGEIESQPEKVSNIKPFINNYKWKGLNYPSKIDDWKTFKKNTPTICLNILYIRPFIINYSFITKMTEKNETQDAVIFCEFLFHLFFLYAEELSFIFQFFSFNCNFDCFYQ